MQALFSWFWANFQYYKDSNPNPKGILYYHILLCRLIAPNMKGSKEEQKPCVIKCPCSRSQEGSAEMQAPHLQPGFSLLPVKGQCCTALLPSDTRIASLHAMNKQCPFLFMRISRELPLVIFNILQDLTYQNL